MLCKYKYVIYHIVCLSVYCKLLFVASGCTYRDIRLYNSTDESTVSDNGMLQICNNAKWTAVCDFNWQCSHAVIACKQLGFSNPSKSNDT